MPASVYLFFGDDEYLVSGRAREVIRSLLTPEEETLGLETIDGRGATVAEALAALQECRAAIRTPGLFDSRKVVWFRDAGFLTDNIVGRSEPVKAGVDELAAMIRSGLPPGQVLIVTSPKVNRKYRFYKACKETGEIGDFGVAEKPYQKDRNAAARLRTIVAEHGLRFGGDTEKLFLLKVGTDTRQIVNEVEKLASFLGERKDITAEDVQAVTCSSRSALAWDLADAFGKRELGNGLKVLRRLVFQRESVIGLILGIYYRIRLLMIYRQGLDAGWLRVTGKDQYRKAQWGKVPPEIETMFSEGLSRDPRKEHPYRAKLLAEQAAGFSMQELENCQRLVLETHEKMVSTSVPAPILMELLLVRLLPRKQ